MSVGTRPQSARDDLGVLLDPLDDARQDLREHVRAPERVRDAPGRAADEHQAAHLLGPQAIGLERDLAAHRVTKKHDRRVADGEPHRVEVLRVVA